MSDRLTELKARLDQGEITRSGYLRALRELRDEGGITAHAYTSAVGQAQRDALTVRGIPAAREPRDHRTPPYLVDLGPLDYADRADAADGPLGKKDLQPGTPTQNIGVEDVMGVAGGTDGVMPEPDYRGAQAVRTLRKIVRQNPDASLAVSTAKRVAATKWKLSCFEIGKDGPTETPAPEAEAEARRFIRRVMRSHGGGGIEALLEVGLDSIITDGAVALELDVAKSLDDVRDIVPVDVTVVRFQTRTMPDGQRVLVPVFKPTSGEPKPFNLNQFAYSGLDTTVTDPYGRPWILPVLDTAPAQHKLRNTMHKVMVHQGYARLAASVDWNRVSEQMPMSAITPEQKRSYMQNVLGGITTRLKDLKPDDAVALYDFVKLTVVGASHGSQSIKSQEITDIYDTDNAAALKTPPSILGRSSGHALSTNADIHWWVYALAIEALRLHVTRVVSWAISQYLRIRGIAAYAVVEFEAIRKTDTAEEEDTLKARQERLIAARDAGLIDDDAVRAGMGYAATAAPTTKPAAATRAADPAPAVDVDRADATTDQLLAGLITPCSKCGCANLRRPNGQVRCRKCGAYITARRAAVEDDDPDLAAALADVAADLQERGIDPEPAREYLEMYADSAATLGLDDACDCEECAVAWERAERAEKFQPTSTAVKGAIELGQAYAFPGDDDGQAAAEAWRQWARENEPRLAELPFATLYDEDEDEDRALRATPAPSIKPTAWQWDKRTHTYREAANPSRALSEATVRRAYERRMTEARRDIRALTDRLASGKITPAEWQDGMGRELRQMHLQARMLAVGGKDRMTQRHYGSVGGLIRADTDRLARFGQAVAKGELSMAQVHARAQLYAQANIRRDYERGRVMSLRDEGYELERRVLLDSADHCKGCVAEAKLNWQPIGSLAPIGGHECRANDMCHKEHRYSKEEATKPRPKRSEGGAGWPGVYRLDAPLVPAREPIAHTNGLRG